DWSLGGASRQPGSAHECRSSAGDLRRFERRAPGGHRYAAPRWPSVHEAIHTTAGVATARRRRKTAPTQAGDLRRIPKTLCAANQKDDAIAGKALAASRRLTRSNRKGEMRFGWDDPLSFKVRREGCDCSPKDGRS